MTVFEERERLRRDATVAWEALVVALDRFAENPAAGTAAIGAAMLVRELRRWFARGDLVDGRAFNMLWQTAAMLNELRDLPGDDG
jgi:hypothetical protein